MDNPFRFTGVVEDPAFCDRRSLKLIAGTTGKNIFASENLAGFGFRTASQVTAALAGIEKTGILDKNKTWKIHDPFFKRCLL